MRRILLQNVVEINRKRCSMGYRAFEFSWPKAHRSMTILREITPLPTLSLLK